MEHNPYEAPKSNLDAAIDVDVIEAETVRQKYLSHEASIRSIGILYYLGVISGVAMAIAQLAVMTTNVNGISILLFVVFGALAMLYYWVGNGLRALQPRVKPVAGGLAVLGLLGFPLGTLINGYILYLLFSAKGKMVFSEEYRKVMDATPHIKYKTSAIVWIILAILLLGIVAAVVIPMLQQ